MKSDAIYTRYFTTKAQSHEEYRKTGQTNSGLLQVNLLAAISTGHKTMNDMFYFVP